VEQLLRRLEQTRLARIPFLHAFSLFVVVSAAAKT